MAPLVLPSSPVLVSQLRSEKEYKKKRTDMPKSKTARGSSGVLLLYVTNPNDALRDS